MSQGYMHRVAAQTPTRFWINNPDQAELEQSIAAGARNCTTNPAYAAKLIKGEPQFIHALIDQVIAHTPDDDQAADLAYQAAVRRLLDRFEPIYRASGGREGFVTIQADPRCEHDPAALVAAAERHARLGLNCMVKIPVTQTGLVAIEAMLRQGAPVCATEVFSNAQALSVARVYEQIPQPRPALFITHITGIFDEYLGKVAAREGLKVDPAILAQAGCVAGKEQYRLLREMGCRAFMLGGGARGVQHFTEFVGLAMHITINWSTARELIQADQPVVDRGGAVADAAVIAQLCAQLSDFRRAFEPQGLAVEEFDQFGPVRLFRNNFLEGYYRLLAQVCARRAALAL